MIRQSVNPEHSIVQGRNGTVNIDALELLPMHDDQYYSVDGISAKRHVTVNGGFIIDKRSLIDLCIRFLSCRGYRIYKQNDLLNLPPIDTGTKP